MGKIEIWKSFFFCLLLSISSNLEPNLLLFRMRIEKRRRPCGNRQIFPSNFVFLRVKCQKSYVRISNCRNRLKVLCLSFGSSAIWYFYCNMEEAEAFLRNFDSSKRQISLYNFRFLQNWVKSLSMSLYLRHPNQNKLRTSENTLHYPFYLKMIHKQGFGC